MGRAGDSLVHDSPMELGMKPSLCGSPCREKTGWPVGKMIVVVVVVVIVMIVVVESYYFFNK